MKKGRQYLAGILAVVIMAVTIFSALPPMVTYAAAAARQKSQVWQGTDVTVLGHWRPTLYRWYNANDGKDLLCISQGKYMIEGTVLEDRQCYLGDTVPNIDTSDQFICLSKICSWYETGVRNDLRYAVAQFAVWAVMEGHYRDMSAADGDMTIISTHIKGRFMEQWGQLKDYLSRKSAMPSWAASVPSRAPYQRMVPENGVYQLKLDISSCPQLLSVPWTLPGDGWGKKAEGDQLIFTYNGGGEPEGILTADISSVHDLSWNSGASFNLYSTTDPTFQLMINGLDVDGDLYVRIGGTSTADGEEGVPPVTIYLHEESFQANYQVELNKSCAETGNMLQGAVFQVKEQFEPSQLGDLRREEMSPYFQGSRDCQTMTTDDNGYAIHRDKKFYEYSRTYCTGHPEPEYPEIPEEEVDEITGEVTNGDEIAEAEEENERLSEEYEAQIEACEESTDFHDVDGNGLNMMLEDRDGMYDQFIHLPYIYTMKEITARNGYILHGLHEDDEEIEVITAFSSEAGGYAQVIGGPEVWAAGLSSEYEEIPEEKSVLGIVPIWNSMGTNPEPAPADARELDELRVITSGVLGLEEEMGAAEDGKKNKGQGGSNGPESEEPTVDEGPESEEPTVDEGPESEESTVNEGTDSKEPADDEGAEGEKPAVDEGTEGRESIVDEERKAEECFFIDESRQGMMKVNGGLRSQLLESKADGSLDYAAISMIEVTDNPVGSEGEETPGQAEAAEQETEDEAGKDSEQDDNHDADADADADTDTDTDTDTDANASAEPEELPVDEDEGVETYTYTIFPYRLSGYFIRNKSAGTFALPSPIEDDEPWIVPEASDLVSYLFAVRDHRTEGEVHINKRDMKLYEEDPEGSYGKTQGDATLAGAVYGLYAAENIGHPDGKTGTVFQAGELVAISTTDENGDASFLVITEESETSKAAHNLEGSWTGHPLVLGNYFIKEIARSEGYELSVSGKNFPHSNRTASAEVGMTGSGTVKVQTALRHPVENYDGSWNDFQIWSRDTGDGYDITVTGYPEGSIFHRVVLETETKIMDEVVGKKQQPKLDEFGNIIYKVASGGEKKLGEDGNHIRATDPETGEPLWDMDRPASEVCVFVKRTGNYPSGTAEPEDRGRRFKSEAIEGSYVREEADRMLKQLGYRMIEGKGEGAPWYQVMLSGDSDASAVTEILDWYTTHYFYDSAGVESVFEKDGEWFARLYADYRGHNANAILDARGGALYIKNPMTVTDGAKESHYWIKYEADAFHISGNVASISEKRAIPEGTAIAWGEEYESQIMPVYEPLYETYQAGEVLADSEGKPLMELETVPVVRQTAYEETKEVLYPVEAVRREDGSWRIREKNQVDWDVQTEAVVTRYRAQAPEKTAEVDGQVMAYGDYLTQVLGAGVSVTRPERRAEEDSFVKFINLVYPGQFAVYQDEGTRQRPVIVLERVIMQAICVTKDIAQESYDHVNTYRIHRDPFTVLFGGYLGRPGAKTVKGFCFRLYRKQELENTGLLEVRADGKGFDYERLFEEHPEYRTGLAIGWDEPEKDLDRDLTTIHAVEGSGIDDYYGVSIPLPYGAYVLVEQQPEAIPNKHYETDLPQEIELPFVPDVEDGSLHEERPSGTYVYFSGWSPQKQNEKFGIRFYEEQDIIKAHNNDGDFLVFKYGVSPESEKNCQNEKVAAYYHYGVSEKKGLQASVYYDRYYNEEGVVTDYGITLHQVPSMAGVSTAVDRKYARALVPWSILKPMTGGTAGPDGGGRQSGLDEHGEFNFVAYANADMENRFYHSRIRIEKLDEETGESIIHDGALFRIFAANRAVSGGGPNGVEGSGSVIYVTETVTGTRQELEAMGYVDHIHWEEAAQTFSGTVTIPDYDRSQQIIMEDEMGNEVGIFKAYSTIQEVVTESGKIEKLPVGYIETCQPLGAGVYVLVEIQAPSGYQVSKPVAFEIYSDQVVYYKSGKAEQPVKALQFEYAIPVVGEENKYGTVEVSQVKVEDIPSKMTIRKVEDGDESVGDENGLDGLTGVNDQGDLLTYKVQGRKEYLEARGDVKDIRWLEDPKLYEGTAVKRFDCHSETLIEGTEAELRAMEGVKPLYRQDGSFTGKGIRFGIPVNGVGLSLYQGLALTRQGDGTWSGVQVKKNENGSVIQILANQTGSHKELLPVGKDDGPAHKPIWDAEAVSNQELSLFFYQLAVTPTRLDEVTGELYVLDDRGNPICMADPDTGMAYVYDDYGKAMAYVADSDGKKQLVKSIQVKEGEQGTYLYEELEAVLDENGLPVYYTNGNLTYKGEQWTTSEGGTHTITRLPFGAYVLEESSVPYEDGYIRSMAMGIRLHQSGEEQTFYFQNAFTKIDISKVDTQTKQNVRDARLVLRAGDTKVASWISGYAYKDDQGEIKTDSGEYKLTSGPHWIDHLPPGEYTLEETEVPYKWGYVSREPMNLTVKETGDVQTFVMDNDYTSVEIRKQDKDTKKVLASENPAGLTLYRAVLDQDGKPVLQNGPDVPPWPVWREEDQVVSWVTEDGSQTAATGKTVTDEYGETRMVYTYQKHKIKESQDMRQAVYYITETGNTRFDYLPIGYYVLVETKTPSGYATSDPILIKVEDIGQEIQVQKYVMEDVPLKVDIMKIGGSLSQGSDTDHIGKNQVMGAVLAVYQVFEDGSRSTTALDSWVSGKDGKGKAHRIFYIPVGNYVLVELETPYGFLKSEDVYFSIEDTEQIQIVSMWDHIPDGRVMIFKHDQEDSAVPLKGAVFELKNLQTGKVEQRMTTDSGGRCQSGKLPSGFLGREGSFEPYTYTITEMAAPDGYMRNPVPFEFQFTYEGAQVPVLLFQYDASDRQNQVKISKKNAGSLAELPGAELVLVEKPGGREVERWITTGQPHYINGIPVGNYRLIEAVTPGPGYAKAADMEVTITDHMTEPLEFVMIDETVNVEIRKTDGRGRLLSGARLRLTTLDGVVAAEWTSENKPENFYGLIPGVYKLTEVTAPAGYEKGSDMEIVVTDGYEVQTFGYRNYRIDHKDDPTPNEPDKPEKPKDVLGVKIGTITAVYKPVPVKGRTVKGRTVPDSKGKGVLGIKTGDDTPLLPVLMAFIGCAAIFITVSLRKKKK